MNRRSISFVLALVFSVAVVACGSAAAEPTALPPTSTPAPTPTPGFSIITVSPELDFDAFVAQMPPADIECITSVIGEDRLRELAAGGSELGDDENATMQRCFSNEFVVGFLAGQVQSELGTFSGSSAACVESLLNDLPPGLLTELVTGEDGDESLETQLAMQELSLCLTQEELEAFARATSGDDGGAGEQPQYASPAEQCMVGELGQSFADGYGERLDGGLFTGFSNAIETCGIEFSVDGMIEKIEDSERKYTVADLEAAGFKKSKFYDVTGLEGASSVHYGFYGADPYSRLDYEARFYFSHEGAKTSGIEFANDATGAGVSLYEDDQRWTEGLSERRRCDSSGGHHVGRCGFPKYFDYVVAGNMVLLCQGKDTLESLNACSELLEAIP